MLIHFFGALLSRKINDQLRNAEVEIDIYYVLNDKAQS